ncbi:MAG: zinc-binding dehydrogenase [Planctomycetota bacterium]|jgi:D-arabinose 1-dehydrogenase-like Zn-dependent alcohol dehydrogenase
MKAWMVTAVGAPADVLEIGEREPPDPVPGEVGVEVRVAAAGLPDVFMCRGQYEFDPPLPFTPGEEVAGVVTDARHAPGFEPGQRVMGVTAFYRGHGGFAERSVLVADATWPIPEEMSDVDAAAFGIPFRTAYLGLVTRGRLSEGETLLVHGAAGGTGFAAVQVGKAVGARVIAVASGAEKCQACRESGANEVIDRSQRDFVDTVKALTEGRGVDVVFDPVGGDTFVQPHRGWGRGRPAERQGGRADVPPADGVVRRGTRSPRRRRHLCVRASPTGAVRHRGESSGGQVGDRRSLTCHPAAQAVWTTRVFCVDRLPSPYGRLPREVSAPP